MSKSIIKRYRILKNDKIPTDGSLKLLCPLLKNLRSILVRELIIFKHLMVIVPITPMNSVLNVSKHGIKSRIYLEMYRIFLNAGIHFDFLILITPILKLKPTSKAAQNMTRQITEQLLKSLFKLGDEKTKGTRAA